VNLILGAGISGLSASYHLGHASCLLLEQGDRPFGHVKAVSRDGFTWDEGPHVSFTKHAYVRDLFAASVDGEFEEYVARATNYFRGHWIDHPAQVSLYQVPEPLRSQCLDSFLESRDPGRAGDRAPADYQEWLERAFGPVFAETFPAAYTRKYWTRAPRDLSTAWVGERILFPTVEDVVSGARGPLGRDLHYITTVRYPRRGGYESFIHRLGVGARIQLGTSPVSIDLPAREVRLADGTTYEYERLISTIPLPRFLQLCGPLPPPVREASDALSCSELLLVNVAARHPARRPETWMYVYDEDRLATRISLTEHLSPGNAPPGCTGAQVEVYGSRHRALPGTPDEIMRRVGAELTDIGLIDPGAVTESHHARVPWANVIFDHDTKPALEVVWTWLEQFGLQRAPDDTHPLTDWGRPDSAEAPAGPLVFAGRFGQWKYFWTDDCVLRGRQLAGAERDPVR
jgi:protoporphyrinogen oxidase